jgi:Protein of unknown function, DUF547
MSIVLVLVVTLLSLTHAKQIAPSPAAGTMHRAFDEILDLNVRDGLVYYRALQSGRAQLDRYIASLDVPSATYESWSKEAKMAFWLNAYNAIVLQTVINRYPIRGKSDLYPSSSIRQIPGAFDTLKHRAASRSVTLDEIEKTLLPDFQDPRLHLTLGRGAIGSGRLRSEAYTAERLAAQLDDVQKEFASETNMIKIDRDAGRIAVTAIVSWNSDHFIKAYDTGANGPLAQRSPIERALIAFIKPHLLPLEREFVEQNTFSVTYQPFDWRLNDLTGGAPR